MQLDPARTVVEQDKDRGMTFLQDVMQLAATHLQDRTNPYASVRPKAMTARAIRDALCDWGPDEERSNRRRSHKALLNACDQVIQMSVRTAHPNFISQIYSKADLYGVAADLIVTVLNNNVHVFELSPALTVIEREMINYLSRVFGFSDVNGKAPYADGVFVAGGSAANMHALYVARHKAKPAFREDGPTAEHRKLVAFCGEGAHYSMEKAAMVLGIGRLNMRKIPGDADGRMRVDLLEQAISDAIAKDETPFCVCATAGTTVLSAFDPLRAIAQIAHNNGVWLHVDAAWGGAAAFSPIHAHLVDGIGEADSLTFSAHKMLGAPLQCAAFLVHPRHGNLIKRAMAVDAPYLYQNSTERDDDEPDFSRNTLQCGRRGDAFKLWLMREAVGDEGFSERVDGCADWAAEFYKEVKVREGEKTGFVGYKYSFSTVCFWYLPSSLRSTEIEELEPGSVAWDVLDRLPEVVRATMIKEGERILVSYGSAPGVPNFFRFGLSSAPGDLQSRKNSIDFVLDNIAAIAERLHH